MDIIATDMQQLEQDVMVQLFEIDATRFGQGIIRFSSTSNNRIPLSFGGLVYPPFPVKCEGFEWNGSGTMPRPTLTLAAKDLFFLALILNADDLVGCPVKRIRTYRKYLDDGATPNAQAMFPPDNYVVEAKKSQKRTQLVFELSVEMDQQGRMIPARQVLRDSCTHRFRYWANNKWNYAGVTCPYAGDMMYQPDGTPTNDPTKAQCGKRLEDCETHFGINATLPFYGYPGVGRI